MTPENNRLKWYFVSFCFFLILSCARSNDGASVQVQRTVPPIAVLQPGEYPLWFQLTDGGPVLLETIEDALYSAALVPWPLSEHVRFVLAGEDGLLFAVNRSGFLKFAPWQGGDSGLGLFRFSGGDFWRQYTAGAFFLYDGSPAALLYLDDRFLDTDFPAPSPRTWTFNMETGKPFPLDIPALEQFPAEEGWGVDSLRLGNDGFWYYRAVKNDAEAPQVRMLRTDDLSQTGEDVPLGVFLNSAMGVPLHDAGEPLRSILSAAFATTGAEAAHVLSPDFLQPHFYMKDSESDPYLLVFYDSGGSEDFALAVLPTGAGLFLSGTEYQVFSLPPLPQGFVYTWLGMTGDSLIACWEEQEDYNTGAAGFMVVRRDSYFSHKQQTGTAQKSSPKGSIVVPE
ncbi:MAG: hypothetical protein FWG99_12165 [Treponema sp.]|nr:hypothetical protein [Treponema sp.]